MKKIGTLILLLLLNQYSFSQVKRINSINSMVKMIELKDEGLKYYNLNRRTNTVSLYNLNGSIFKTFNLKVPANQSLDEVKSLSQYKINKDKLIEIIYTTVNAVSIEPEIYSEMKPPLFTLNVTNEIGEELLIVPGANHFEIMNHGVKKVLIVFRSELYESNPEIITEIYTLLE